MGAVWIGKIQLMYIFWMTLGHTSSAGLNTGNLDQNSFQAGRLRSWEMSRGGLLHPMHTCVFFCSPQAQASLLQSLRLCPGAYQSGWRDGEAGALAGGQGSSVMWGHRSEDWGSLAVRVGRYECPQSCGPGL